jgi:hypothetical protein
LFFQLSDQSANSAGWLFTFASKTFTNAVAGRSTVTSAAFQALLNGWYRLEVVVHFSSVAAQLHFNRGAWNDTSGDGTNGATGFVEGAQSEDGMAFVTSYIPTTTVAVTRAEDDAIITSIPWFNSTQGTAIYSFIPEGELGAVNNQYVYAFSDGTTTNSIYSDIIATSAVVGGIGSNISGEALGTSVGTISTTGLAYKNAAHRFAENGSLDTAGTFGGATLPTGISQLMLGNFLVGASSPCDCWERAFTYYNTAMSAAQLQAQTR